MTASEHSQRPAAPAAKIIALAFAAAAALALAAAGSRAVFTASAKEKLQREAEMQILRFGSQLNAEIKLALQMAQSPVVKAFLMDTADESLAAAGIREIRLYQESFLGKTSFWASTCDDIFWSDCKPLYKIDPEDPSQYWYKMTLYETDVYNFNINYNEEMDQTGLWLNAVVRDDAGTPVGMVGTGIPLDSFISDLFASIRSDKSLIMFMFNSSGEITGAADKNLVSDKIQITAVLPALAGREAASDRTRFISSPRGEYILAPMTSVGWTLVLCSPFNLATFLRSAPLPFGLLLLAVFSAAILTVSVRVFRPLDALEKTVALMSAGNADLTQRIRVKLDGSLPVIRSLVGGFNAFIEKIQETVRTLKASEERMEASRVKLKDGTDSTLSLIEELSQDFGSFGQGIKRQAESVGQTAATMNRISGRISSLDGMIATQTSAVKNASGAVEQLLGNIRSVNGSIEMLSGSFAVLERNSSEGVTKHRVMSEKITQIQEESKMLAEANKVISSIASQTNLLAMNAAIEAAHAGEFGRGFSVVADEIRKLSENSSAQSKTISQKLSDIQNSISEVVAASSDAGTAFHGISKNITDTSALVQEITQAMAEQESGSIQISGSLRTLNDSSSQVRAASGEMNDGSKAILSEVTVLQATTETMRDGMETLDKKSNGMKSTQCELSALSQEMDTAIRQMRESLDRFTV